MNKKFIYKGKVYDGLFTYLKKNSLTDQFKLIRDSYQAITTDDFCHTSGYYGADVNTLIDGNEKSSWINKDGIDKMYLIIDLKIIHFKISGMIFYSSCNVPDTLIIEGSFDNSKYEFISNQTNIEDFTPNYFKLKPKKPYRYIKLRQNFVKVEPSNLKLHISELELFGTLNPSEYSIVQQRYLAIKFIFFVVCLFVAT